MKGIFISYRREDAAGYAGRLYDRLAAHFGTDRVFMDVEGIEPGVDFVEALERAVGSCEVLIVIIGKDWLAVGSAGKRRLDDPADFVRIETAAALARNIRVVPVLVDDAEMPRADQLPKDLASLARRQAVELSHKQWDATSAELIHALEKILNAGKQRVAETAPPESEPPSPVLLAMQGRGVAPALAELARPAEKPAGPVSTRPAEPVPARPAEPVPPRPAELVAPRPVVPPQPKPEVPAPPKILHFEASVANDNVLLCYAVQNAASAVITPSPGEVKPLAKECVPVAAGRTYTLTARNAAGAAVTRTVTVEAAASPPPAPLATPSAWPRVGDTWVYRFQSRWKNVEQRFYTHQVAAVSEREVRETMSYTPSVDKASESKTFAPDTRFVEWRGKGYYFVEFNPFLQAFGALQPGTTWKPLSIPVEDPFFGGWYTTGRAIDWDSVTVPAGAFKAIRVQ